MDQNLFKKYTTQIKNNEDIKQEICLFILNTTNILLNEKELQINKKKIHIQISSVKRVIFIQKKIKELLQEKGYTVIL